MDSKEFPLKKILAEKTDFTNLGYWILTSDLVLPTNEVRENEIHLKTRDDLVNTNYFNGLEDKNLQKLKPIKRDQTSSLP